MTCWDVWVQCREHLLEANLTSGNYKKGKGEQKKPNVPVPDIADTTGFLSGVSAQLKLSQ